MDSRGNASFSLDDFHWKVFMDNLPVSVSLVVLAALGITGNVLTLMYYRQKGTSKTVNFLISSLAMIDLSVCVLLFAAVAEICFNVKYSSGILCQTMYFTFYSTIYSSILTLSLICIDRYRKICKPFNTQMSLTVARRSFVALVITAFMISSRTYVTYDVIVVEFRDGHNGTTRSYQCETANDPNLYAVVYFFHLFDIVNVGSIFVIFVVTYSLIIRSLYHHIKKLKRMGQPFALNSKSMRRGKDTVDENTRENSTNDDAVSSSTIMDSRKQLRCKTSRETSDNAKLESPKQQTVGDIAEPRNSSFNQAGVTRFCNNTDEIRLDKGSCNNGTRTPNERAREIALNFVESPKGEKTKNTGHNDEQSTLTAQTIGSGDIRAARIKKSEIQITIMMLVVTLWFLASFTPYFASIEIANEFPISASTHFFQKCTFLNSIMNPIIYYVFNQDFRSFLNGLICKRNRL